MRPIWISKKHAISLQDCIRFAIDGKLKQWIRFCIRDTK